MTDTTTRTPAPREALDEFEQLAAEVAMYDRDRIHRILSAWYASTSRGARRRYDDAVRRAERLALDSGRVVETDDGAIVTGAAAAFERLDDLLISSPVGRPVPVLVDIAYAMLTADLLDGADLEAITNRWAGALEGTTTTGPTPDVVDVPLYDEPTDAQVVDVPARPAPRPRRTPRPPAAPGPVDEVKRDARAARLADPVRRRRRLRVRGVLAFVFAALSFIAACVLLGLAGAGDVPAGVAGAVLVLAATLAVVGAIATRAAGRIRLR